MKAKLFLSFLMGVGWLAATLTAHALTFNVTYDASTAGAPAGFFTAFNDTVQFYEAQYTDPITINLQVGWGQIAGQDLNSGEIGQSITYQQGYDNYAQVKSWLANDAKSAADATAIASLGPSDPMGGANFVMSTAEAKALGLLPGNAPGLDGYVGFDSTVSYTFDPSHRGVSGKYDFIGLAGHEITEVMGRYGLGQNGASSGLYSPLDLFRYVSPGVLDLTPASGGAYLSIDGGNSAINTFNGTAAGGDLSDWAGFTLDSYNHSLTKGRELDASAGDLVEMDVIGYDPAVVPEPATWALVVIGVSALVGLRARRR